MPIAPKKIILTKGQAAWVDAEDFDRVSQFKWFAQWNIKSSSYFARRNGVPRMMSRFVLGVADPSVEVDHKNHNTLDNQKHNLRIVDQHQNRMNQRKRKDNSSGFKGVSHHKSGRRARITAYGKVHFLGYFSTAQEAYEAYKVAALTYHGEYACLE